MRTGLQRLQSSKLTNNLDSKQNDSKQNPIKRFLKFKDKGLNLEGCTDSISSIFFGTKKQLIQKGIEKFQQKLDIIFIIRKLIEIDKLKALILTKNQLKLFDYIPKPMILESKEIKQSQVFPEKSDAGEIDFFMVQKPIEIQIEEALQAYEQINEEINQEPINIKLIQMLDPEIKQLFEEALLVNKQQEPILKAQSRQSPPIFKESFKDPLEEFDYIISNREIVQ